MSRPTFYILAMMIVGLLGYEDIPILWEASPIPVIEEERLTMVEIILVSPCKFMRKENFHPDHFSEAQQQCQQRYEAAVEKELGQMCPTTTESHHRQKREFVTMAIVGVVGAAAVGVGGASYAKAYENEKEIDDIQYSLKDVNKQVDTLESQFHYELKNTDKDVEVLRLHHDELVNHTSVVAVDFHTYMQTAVRSAYDISFYTSHFETFRAAIQEQKRRLKNGILYMPFFDALNQTLGCDDSCIFSLSSIINCNYKDSKLYMLISIPIADLNKTVLKANPFTLLKREETQTCKMEYTGISALVLNKNRHENRTCGSPIRLEATTQYIHSLDLLDEICAGDYVSHFNITTCRPTKKGDEREFVQVKRLNDKYHIYCPESTFTFNGLERKCSERVFNLPLNSEFSIRGRKYTYNTVSADTRYSFEPLHSLKANLIVKPTFDWTSLKINGSELANLDTSTVIVQGAGRLRKETIHWGFVLVIVCCVVFVLLCLYVVYKVKSKKISSNSSKV